MLISPYLHFNGDCESAFKFYEKCLGAKIEAMFPHEGTRQQSTCRQNGGARSCTPPWLSAVSS